MARFSYALLSGVALAAFASTAHAETPVVRIGGLIHFQGGYTDQETAFEAGTRHHALRNDTEVNVDVSAKTETGLAYGAAIELEADTSADAPLIDSTLCPGVLIGLPLIRLPQFTSTVSTNLSLMSPLSSETFTSK
jgi:hypothetical protein